MNNLIEPPPEFRKKILLRNFRKISFFFFIFLIIPIYFIINHKSSDVKILDNATYIINVLKEDFKGKKLEISNSRKSATLLSEEQYNNIIHIYSTSPKKTVYLTFDDGPSSNITPLILDLLKKEDIRATFFVLGTNVEKYPDIIKREYSEGHFLANHGYSHKYSEIYESKDTILNDYSLCEQAIKKVLNNENFTSKVYRFPGGSSGGFYNEVKLAGREYLKQNNIAYLDWNALTYDAEGTPTHESILENLEQTVGNKDVVVLLMHDSSSKILTYETLPEVIAFFRDNGFTFRSLYDIL